MIIVIRHDPFPDARRQVVNSLARKFADGEITKGQYDSFVDYAHRYLGVTYYKKGDDKND